jgi:hypothetical protein
MSKITAYIYRVLFTSLSLFFVTVALAGPVYQPAGTNLTYGDVTHGQRTQSASGNPAAAAADSARQTERPARGAIISAAAGLEYGNIENIFDFYDDLTNAYDPSDPGSGGGPGQNPGDKPEDGIDLGDIWDSLDPDFQATIDAVAQEVVTQAALLAIIRNDGYGRAWLSADVPILFGGERFGGVWTFNANWSGASKAFGLVEPIEFDEDAARAQLEDWYFGQPSNLPAQLPLGDQVRLLIDPLTNAVKFVLQNDSSMVSKAVQTTELNVGYSRHAWSNESGSLFLGAEARLYLMRLSRLSVRFGDITNSEELFDAIGNSEFRNAERMGVDIGALWVGNNYQIGVQMTNINQPNFIFPEVNLDPYSNEGIIDFLQQDQVYTMDRQVKLEASLFSSDRRWSTHLGIDADSATDPLGDDFQWLTLSAAYDIDSLWIPSARIGFRQNLAGTEMKYVGIGFTAFKFVNFDIASALDSVKIDGKKLPQGLMASIGFQISW